MSYNWPGNDRQFRRVIHNFMYLHVSRDAGMEMDSIEWDDLVASLRDEQVWWSDYSELAQSFPPVEAHGQRTSAGATLYEQLQQIRRSEQRLIEQAILERGNPNAAAKALQMNRQQLINRIEKLRGFTTPGEEEWK